jgi:sulfite exporter TauE/SafE
VSLPSLVVLISIDLVVRVRQGRPTNAMRGLAFGLGSSPSLAAIAVLVGHFSVIAAAVFVLLTLYWSLTILAAAIDAGSGPKSEL